MFKNVYVSRGPVKGELGVLPILEREEGPEETEEEAAMREAVAGWTHFHLSIATVEVSLSLRRWLDGKGLIEAATVRGVRGVVGASRLHHPLLSPINSSSLFPPSAERSHLIYDPNAPKDRFAYRNKPRPGDFHLDGLVIEDFLVTIYQPEHFRPVRLSSTAYCSSPAFSPPGTILFSR